MLSLEDERWATLSAGYRIPVDLRPLLRQLEAEPQASGTSTTAIPVSHSAIGS